MADSFADEIKWWNKRAAVYQKKRANIRPVSFEYLSKAYSSSGSLNGGWLFDSSRETASLAIKQRDIHNQTTIDPSKVKKPGVGSEPLTPQHASVAAPSQDVLKLDKQVDTTEAKLKAMGSDAFRTVVGGLVRVADLLSRPGYAIRANSLQYAKVNAADGSTTFMEHAENALRPILDLAIVQVTAPLDRALGVSNPANHAMWEGFTGREKTYGTDILKVAFPEFTSDHKKWTSVLGFGMDVVYDPLSWITVGEGTIVTGAAKGVAAGGARVAGKEAVAKGMLSNTIWTASGRAAGMRSVRQGINVREAKPITKKLDKVNKPLNKIDKGIRRAERKGDVAKQVNLTAERTRYELAHEAVVTQLTLDLQDTMQHTFTGMQLARKAILNKGFGLGTVANFNRGVRAGGINNKATKELAALHTAGRDKAIEHFKDVNNPDAADWRNAHALIAGDTITTLHGGVLKKFDVPEDYDDFVDELIPKIFPEVKVTELTSKALKARQGKIGIADAEANQFFNDLTAHVTTKFKAMNAGNTPPRIKQVFGPAAKSAEQAKKAHMAAVIKATAAASKAKDAATKGAADAAQRLADAKTAYAAAQASHADLVEASKLAKIEADKLDAEVDAALEAMGVAAAKRDELRAASEAARTPETLMDDTINGVSSRAAYTRDTLTANQANVYDTFVNAAREKLEAIPGVTTSDTPVGFEVNPVIEGGQLVEYTRAKNAMIAEAISESYALARTVAAHTIVDQDPEVALLAIEGATAHILNMLSADTHLQVAQFMAAKHQISLLPMAPNISSVVTAGRLDPVRAGTLWSDPFVYTSRNGNGTITISPDDMKKAAQGRLNFEYHAAVDFLESDATLKTPISLSRYADEYESMSYDEYVTNIMRHYTYLGTQASERTKLTKFSDVPVYRGLDSESALGGTSVQEAVETFVRLGMALVKRDAGFEHTSISDYSMLDYWMYTDNVSDELRLSSKGIGRLAHVEKMAQDLDSTEAIAKAVESIPNVDEELVAAIKVIKAELKNNPSLAEYQAVHLKRIVGRVIAPDVKRVTNKTFKEPTLDEAMKSLGYHLWVLTDTNDRIGPVFTPAFRIQLARRVWEIPALMQQLNQAVMMNTLHYIYSMGVSAEQAADRIAESTRKYPQVYGLMRGAHDTGATRGNVGIRPPKAVTQPIEDILPPVGSVPEGVSENLAKVTAVDPETIRIVSGADYPSGRVYEIEFKTTSGEVVRNSVVVGRQDGKYVIRIHHDLQEVDSPTAGWIVGPKKFNSMGSEDKEGKLIAYLKTAMPKAVLPKKYAQQDAAVVDNVKALRAKAEEANTAVAATKTAEASSENALLNAQKVVTEEEAKAFSAADSAATAQKKYDALEAKKAELESNAVSDPAATGNAPGGHSAPDTLDEATKLEVEKAIEDLMDNIDIAGINASINRANKSMIGAMAEYSAFMAERTKNMDIRVGRTLRFAGLPIAPLPSITSPTHSYAGVVALKESQGRVANWMHIGSAVVDPDSVKNRYLTRPSRGLEGTINDMRRSSSNNAQNRVMAIATSIHNSYKQYKNKAEMNADIKAFFDGSIADVGVKMQPTAVNFDMVREHIKNVAAKEHGNATAESLNDAVRDFNSALPKPFRLPDELFESTHDFAFKTAEEPYSREWLIAASKHLEKHNISHRMAQGNLGRFDMAGFDFAAQHALSKVELRDELYLSMFDHFSFDFKPEYVNALNATLSGGEEYVKLGSIMGKAHRFGDVYADRYVSRDLANEMLKVTNYIESATKYHAGDLNFGFFAKVNNYWKAMVTTWNVPKYHIANVMSDAFLSAIDGTKLRHYEKAMTVMANSHELSGRVKSDPKGYEALMRPDMPMVNIGDDARHLEDAIAKAGDPTRAKHVTRIMVNGRYTNLTSEDIMKLYVDYGLSQNQVNGNLLRSTNIHANNKASAAATAISDKVLDLSQGREDYFRIAHFIHALENEALIPGRSLAEITKAARDRVIKYHFDYGDVTEWERLYLGRYMPFYKWTRNIVPLAVSQLFTNPKAYTISNAMNKTMGELFFPTQEDSNGNTIPASYITPSWVADANMVPIGVYTDPNGNEQARYAVLNLPLDQTLAQWIMPFADPSFDPTKSTIGAINEGASNVASSMLGASNPFIKAIMQAGLGKTPVPGDSYEAKPYDWLKTLGAVALPGSSLVMQASKESASGAPQADSIGLLDNFGFIRQTASKESSVKGTLREQQDRLTAILRQPEDEWVAKNYPGIDPRSDEGRKLVHKYYVERGILQK